MIGDDENSKQNTDESNPTGRTRQRRLRTDNTTNNDDEPLLYIKVKEENENLKSRVDQLELELNEKTKSINSLERRNDRLLGKLESKDKSISKLRDNLKQLKDDIQIVNENIGQAKSSALFIKAEDEHL